MKEKDDSQSGKGTKDGNSKGVKSSTQKSEPKKKTDTGKKADTKKTSK